MSTDEVIEYCAESGISLAELRTRIGICVHEGLFSRYYGAISAMSVYRLLR